MDRVMKTGVRGRGPGAGKRSVLSLPATGPGRPAPLLLLTLCLFTFASVSCAVDERRQVSPEAQATIDRVTEDIASGRDEKLYEEAADEWRASISAEDNGERLEQLRARLGRVRSRAIHSGTEKDNASGKLPGHSLVVTYQTTFERATAMETFTLLEREGRWLLAGYTVTSDALK